MVITIVILLVSVFVVVQLMRLSEEASYRRQEALKILGDDDNFVMPAPQRMSWLNALEFCWPIMLVTTAVAI